MKMFLIDVENNKTEVVDCDGELQSLYDLVKCDYVEIVERNICGVECNIICDEEGKLKNKRLSGVMYDKSDYFVGNLLICGMADSEGNLTGLKDEEIEIIQDCIGEFDYEGESEPRKILLEIEY